MFTEQIGLHKGTVRSLRYV